MPYALAYLAVILVQALSVVIFFELHAHRDESGQGYAWVSFHHLQTLSFSFYNVTPVGIC